jgi:minor histocompatibility antigen H13
MCVSLTLSCCNSSCRYYVRKSPFANNTLGLAFTLEGIEQLSLGSTQVGIILLCGLFIYDIFWVFFTPVMVRTKGSVG